MAINLLWRRSHSLSNDLDGDKDEQLHTIQKHESAHGNAHRGGPNSLSRKRDARQTSPTAPEYESVNLGQTFTEGYISPFESLPNEVIFRIAFFLSSDTDLANLTATSSHFLGVLSHETSSFWKQRFLALYDAPFVETFDQYAVAYKLRRFVLKTLQSNQCQALAQAHRSKATHQLLVLQDLILETYNPTQQHSPSTKHSKNLAALSSPCRSEWIVNFMGCPLFGCATRGRPHGQFDSLQLTLSHLALATGSPVSVRLTPSKNNYDLGRVYNYNKPLVLLVERQSDVQAKVLQIQRRKRMTGCHPHKPIVASRYSVDLHSTLHIRNFWQRHFSGEHGNTPSGSYFDIMQSIARKGLLPQKWSRPVQIQSDIEINWLGHYSCLTQWPKTRFDLETQESAAEDWDNPRPLNLQFETSRTNIDDEFWPPAFQNLPVFAQNMPNELDAEALNLTYVRGIATFVNMNNAFPNSEFKQSTSLKWHPFTALRVNGVVHNIPDESMNAAVEKSQSGGNRGTTVDAIPGWKRIMMVMYKRSDPHLVSVLEHAQEDYGGHTNLDTSSIWVQNQHSPSTGSGSESDSDTSTNTSDSSNSTSSTNTDSETSTDPSEEQIQARLRSMLSTRLKAYTATYTAKLAAKCQVEAEFLNSKANPEPLPPLFNAEHIHQLEEAHSSIKYMTWDDGTIEQAYGYEGIIIPGGKIMTGRWWRMHGEDGMGDAREVGPDGAGVEVRPVHQKDGTASERKERRACQLRRSKAGFSRKRKSHISDSGDGDDESDSSMEEESDVEGGDDENMEYEFINMVNGEESRAQNGSQGLDRGPFVFWGI